MQLCTIVNSWHVENKHISIDCHAYSALKTYLATADTSSNSLNTWREWNVYH